MDKIVPVVESLPNVFDSITSCVEVPGKCSDLRGQLQQMYSRECDMVLRLKSEEASNLCKKQKKSVRTLFERMKTFRDMANEILEKYRAGGLRNRIYMVLYVDKYLKEGQYLLSQADQLMMEGLTLDEVYTRGMKLPVEKLIADTMKELREKALCSIRSRDHIIGIHGNLGSGKTNLMKALHNNVHEDFENFKAVFWAAAPQKQQPDIKSLQDCVAEAIQLKLEDEDMARRSSLLAAKFKHMAPGHVVLFLDNVKEQFLTSEVGIPIGCNESENFYCTLVFTAASEDVCNKMGCFTKFKMDLLPEDEARELFLHEAGLNTHCTRSYDRRMEMVVNDVAKQCARVPLVITLIARSMTGKEDIFEWKNRLNELMGIVEELQGDEAKILEQLKFSFNCIMDSTIRGCFLDAANVLIEGYTLTRQQLIEHWVQNRRISRKRGRVASRTTSAPFLQGHTIINELQRVYLLEVKELDGTEFVSMNKWIRKMAMNIPLEELALP